MQDSGPTKKKTRRGGKRRQRKLARDERWRLQHLQDAESEAELPEPTQAEKERTWNQTQLLTEWASGNLVAKPPHPPPSEPPRVRLQPKPKNYTAPRFQEAADLPPAPKYKPTPPAKPPPPPPGQQQQASSSSSSTAPE